MDTLKRKLRATRGSVIRVNFYLNTEAKLTLYHSLMLRLLYHLLVFWQLYAIINHLQRICNKFIRIIFNLHRTDNVKDVMIKKQTFYDSTTL